MEADRKKEFRKVVIKDDTDRLRAELRRARPHVSVEEIESMTREDLVEVITELRLSTGVTTSIKEAVVEEFMEAIEGITPTEIRPEVQVSRSASPVAVMDPMQAMMQMVLLMKREDREKEERRLEDERNRRELEERKLALEKEKEEMRVTLEREKEDKRLAYEREKDDKMIRVEELRLLEEKRKGELRRDELLAMQRKDEIRVAEEKRKEELRRDEMLVMQRKEELRSER